jgi:two-component system, LytTR family, response regulator
MPIQAAYIGLDHKTSENVTEMIKEHFKEIILIAIIDNPTENLELLNHLQLDMLLMDIDDPKNAKADLFDLIPERFASRTVVISKDPTKAVPAMHKGILDFLVNPVEIQEFKGIFRHFKDFLSHDQAQSNIINFDRIIVNRHDKAYLLELDNIHYFDADGPYTTIMTSGGRKISSSKALGYYKELLETKRNFVLLNRSVMINIQNIKEIVKEEGDGTVIMKDGTKMDISRLSKNRLLQVLQELQGNNL